MTSHERAKYQERQEPAGDRVAERPEVLGHGQTGQVAGEGEPDLVARDDLAEPGHPSPALPPPRTRGRVMRPRSRGTTSATIPPS